MTTKKGKSPMSRRRFISGVPSASVVLVAAGKVVTPVSATEPLTAEGVHEYLNSLDGGWVNWEKTVDTFKSGSPGTKVKGFPGSQNNRNVRSHGGQPKPKRRPDKGKISKPRAGRELKNRGSRLGA